MFRLVRPAYTTSRSETGAVTSDRELITGCDNFDIILEPLSRIYQGSETPPRVIHSTVGLFVLRARAYLMLIGGLQSDGMTNA